MADNEQCTDFQFKSPLLPGESCEGIYNKNPESHKKSGYYWISSREYCGMSNTGSSCEEICNNHHDTCDKPGYYRINDKWSYCDMKQTVDPIGDFIPTCAGVGGGWRRVVKLDITAGDDCPTGWRKDSYKDKNYCRVVSDDFYACSSANFPTNGISYQRVCGRARGYQKGWSASFFGYRKNDYTLDRGYADGLLITYGSPRNHIWSYVNGQYDSYPHLYNCPCATGNGFAPPPFVGNNYYCEAGAINTRNDSAYYFNDPLWDGSGCIASRCCDVPTQPWFYRELDETTTSDIEARICRIDAFRVGSTLIDQLELYVQ